jgi:hypothetical protein
VLAQGLGWITRWGGAVLWRDNDSSDGTRLATPHGSEGPLEAGCTRNLEKNRLLHEPQISSENGGQSSKLRRRCFPEAPDLAGAHSGKAATDGSAGAGWIAGLRATGLRKRVTWLPERKSNSRARETGRAAPLRGYRREGLQAVWQAGRHARGRPGMGSRNGHRPRPSAGEQAAQAQAQARAPTQACMRA